MSEDKKVVITGEPLPLPPPPPPPPTKTEQFLENFNDPQKQNRTNTISTVVMAVFTGILTVVSYFQWSEIKDNNADTKRLAEAAVKQATSASEQVNALRDSVRQATLQAQATKTLAENTKMQAEASRISAETAKRGLEVTIESFRLDQRAWVGVSTALISPLDTKKTTVIVNVKNSGKTPAFNVMSYFRTFIDYNLPSRSPITDVSVSTLFPGDNSQLKSEVFFTQAEITSLTVGRTQFIVTGSSTYNDVFDKQHQSNFRFRYDPLSKQLVNDSKGQDAN